jgi:hypothetical protein
MGGSSSYSGQAQAHEHLGYTSKRLGKGGLIQHRRFTHHRQKGIASWGFFFCSSYRPSLFHRGWMVSHAEMGLAPGTPPISRFTFYSYLISFPLLHETGSCRFFAIFHRQPDDLPGAWQLWPWCCMCQSTTMGISDLVLFFSLYFSIIVVFHWCDASYSIIVIAAAC